MGVYIYIYMYVCTVYIYIISYIIYVFFFFFSYFCLRFDIRTFGTCWQNPRHQPVTPVTVALHVKRPSHGGTHPTSGEPSPVEFPKKISESCDFSKMFSFSPPEKTHFLPLEKKAFP